jgi:hypothetical protein
MLGSKGGAPTGSPAGQNFEKSLEEIPTINQDQPMDEEIRVEDIPF